MIFNHILYCSSLFLLFFSFIHCYNFEIGSVNSPVSGKQLASIYQLQNNQDYAELFINEYNSYGGLHIEYISISYCCILVEEGALFYVPTNDLILTYQNGEYHCNTYISGIVQFGVSVSDLYYPTMNSTALQSLNADFSQTCSHYNSYALYGPSYSSNTSPSYSSSHSPTPSASPSRGNNFEVGSIYNPVSGKQLVSLYDLQNNYNYAQMFMGEYNNGGLPIKYISVPYCCIRVQEGALIYLPGGSDDFIITYGNGYRRCETYISSNVKFGSDYGEYFNSITTTILDSWSYETSSACATSDSYALYGPQSSNITPTRTPSPTPSRTRTPTHHYSASVSRTREPSASHYPTGTINNSGDTCCLYFSVSQQYESAFCQKPNYQCPYIGTFTSVGNYTVNDCNSCSIIIPPK